MRQEAKSIFSALTAGMFFVTQTFLAAPGFAATPLSSGEIQVGSPFQLQIPSDFGKVESLQYGRGPAIFHIQDAHGNYEAQKNIQAILHYLKDHYDVRMVLIEGASTKLRPELVRFFPDQMDLTMEIADDLTKEAFLKGPELFLLEAAGIEAYGIENADLYRQNVMAFREVIRQRDKTENFLREMDMQIERLTAPHLNKDLRAFLKRLENYEARIVPLNDWLVTLRQEAEKQLKIDLGSASYQLAWPMLVRVFKLAEFEAQIQPKAFVHERDRFLSEAKRHLSPSLYGQVEALLTNPAEAVLSDPETGLLFENMASQLPEDFNYQNYPNLNATIGHMILRSELDGARLIKEIQALTDAVSDKLAGTETEKKLLSLLNSHRLLKQVFALELTPADYDKILNDKDSYLPSRLIGQFVALNKDGRVRDVRFTHNEEIDALYRSAFDYYRGVKERDHWMFENIDRRIEESGADKVAVITGGFHAQPFAEHYASKGFHYALISPKITALDGRDKYLQAMLQQSLENPAKSNTSQPSLAEPIDGRGEVIDIPFAARLVSRTIINALGQRGQLTVPLQGNGLTVRRTSPSEVVVDFTGPLFGDIKARVPVEERIRRIVTQTEQVIIETQGDISVYSDTLGETVPIARRAAARRSEAKFTQDLEAYVRQAWVEEDRQEYTIGEFQDKFGDATAYGLTEEQIFEALRDIEGRRSVKDAQGKFWFALLAEVNDNGQRTGKLVTFGYAHQTGVQHTGAHTFVFTRNPEGKLVALVAQVRRGQDKADNRYDATSTGHGKLGYNAEANAQDEIIDELGLDSFDTARLVRIRNRAFDQDRWKKVGRKDFDGEAGYDENGTYVSVSKEKYNRELIDAFGVWMDWEEFTDAVTALQKAGGTEEVARVEALTVDELVARIQTNPKTVASGLTAYLDPTVRQGFLQEIEEKIVTPNDSDGLLVASSRQAESRNLVSPAGPRNENRTFDQEELYTVRVAITGLLKQVPGDFPVLETQVRYLRTLPEAEEFNRQVGVSILADELNENQQRVLTQIRQVLDDLPLLIESRQELVKGTLPAQRTANQIFDALRPFRPLAQFDEETQTTLITIQTTLPVDIRGVQVQTIGEQTAIQLVRGTGDPILVGEETLFTANLQQYARLAADTIQLIDSLVQISTPGSNRVQPVVVRRFGQQAQQRIQELGRDPLNEQTRNLARVTVSQAQQLSVQLVASAPPHPEFRGLSVDVVANRILLLALQNTPDNNPDTALQVLQAQDNRNLERAVLDVTTRLVNAAFGIRNPEFANLGFTTDGTPIASILRNLAQEFQARLRLLPAQNQLPEGLNTQGLALFIVRSISVPPALQADLGDLLTQAGRGLQVFAANNEVPQLPEIISLGDRLTGLLSLIDNSQFNFLDALQAVATLDRTIPLILTDRSGLVVQTIPAARNFTAELDRLRNELNAVLNEALGRLEARDIKFTAAAALAVAVAFGLTQIADRPQVSRPSAAVTAPPVIEAVRLDQNQVQTILNSAVTLEDAREALRGIRDAAQIRQILNAAERQITSPFPDQVTPAVNVIVAVFENPQLRGDLSPFTVEALQNSITRALDRANETLRQAQLERDLAVNVAQSARTAQRVDLATENLANATARVETPRNLVNALNQASNAVNTAVPASTDTGTQRPEFRTDVTPEVVTQTRPDVNVNPVPRINTTVPAPIQRPGIPGLGGFELPELVRVVNTNPNPFDNPRFQQAFAPFGVEAFLTALEDFRGYQVPTRLLGLPESVLLPVLESIEGLGEVYAAEGPTGAAELTALEEELGLTAPANVSYPVEAFRSFIAGELKGVTANTFAPFLLKPFFRELLLNNPDLLLGLIQAGAAVREELKLEEPSLIFVADRVGGEQGLLAEIEARIREAVETNPALTDTQRLYFKTEIFPRLREIVRVEAPKTHGATADNVIAELKADGAVFPTLTTELGEAGLDNFRLKEQDARQFGAVIPVLFVIIGKTYGQFREVSLNPDEFVAQISAVLLKYDLDVEVIFRNVTATYVPKLQALRNLLTRIMNAKVIVTYA